MTKNLPTKLGSGHRSGNLKTEKKSQVSTVTSPPLNENNNVNSSNQKPSVVAKMLTPEQRRLANLMNDKVDVLDIEKKINKIMELTGASKDKAIVALHDCANELDKAIDMILEGDSINESEWKSQARKKKPKAVLVNNKEENKMHVNGDKKKQGKNRNNKQVKTGSDKTVQNQSKERSNKRDHWKAKENEELSPKDFSDDKLESWDESVKKSHDQFKPIKYKSSQDRKDKATGNKGNYNRNNERYGPGGDKNSLNSRGSKNYQNKNYKNSGFPNSIDTWTNITAGPNNNANNNDYAQMTVGIWSDVDAHGDLEENFKSKPKFPPENMLMPTYENKNPNLASIVSGVKPHQSLQNTQAKSNQHSNQQKSSPSANLQELDPHGSKHGSQNQQMPPTLQKTQSSQPQRQPNQHQAQQNKIDLAALLKTSQSNSQNLPDQQMNKLIRGNIQRNDSNTYGAALLHRLQQRVQEMGNEAGKNNLNEYVNQYSNQTQDNIKNLVNIPSNNFNSQNPLLLDNQQPQGQTQNLNQQHQIDQKSNKNRITQKRQTKIPETAVEMPNSDHISSLNVQFGALDFGNDNYLNNESNSTNYHEQINNKQNKTLVQNQANNLDNATLLSTVRDTNYRNNQSVDKQQSNTASKDILQNMDQQLSENILERNKQSTNYNKTSLYNQQHNENIGSYKNTYGNQTESHIYPANYNSQNTNYGYVSSNTSQSNNYSVNNYSNYGNNSTQNHNSHSNTNNTSSSNGNTAQKINLKDLDTSTTGNTSSVNTTSSSLGLVSNTTVTTNVLKNSLTATGKNNMQQPNVAAPNVAPLLGTPQYIMSQPGLSAFYPIYDVPMAGPGREHNFGYNPNTQDVKYSRAEANDASNVQSTQAPVTQTPNHQIFSQFPPHYGFFYTGVNMMTQGLYQTAAPFLPVQPPNPGPPSGSTSNSTGFPKGQNQGAYGSHSVYSSIHDPLSAATQLQSQQDYSKQNYSGPNSANPQQSQQQQQSGKQISSGGSNELGNSNMYTKTHAQLTKNYDKPSFQTGTPPPFGIVNAAAALGYNPNQYIPMLQPQSNPSMLHHTLQGDGNQNVSSSGVGGSQRNLSQPQKNSASNSKNYYNWS